MFQAEREVLISDTRKTLQSWGGKEQCIDGGTGGYWVVEFPVSNTADYRFGAYIYDDGEVNSRAKREGAPEDEYFWCKSYEHPDYESVKELHSCFLEELRNLLANPTRIKHKNGIIFGSFECQYNSEESWKSVGGTSYFKFGGFKPPPTLGKIQEYQSGPVFRET